MNVGHQATDPGISENIKQDKCKQNKIPKQTTARIKFQKIKDKISQRK
jgi:hypothetical protein